MSYAKGKHPGAQWRKCDFQIHTPRDEQWSGARSASNTQDVEVARKEWAEEFVQECVKRSLGAVAITDHHDTVFIPIIQEAIQRLGLSSALWFFPGIEVTCNDASQCLLLFDPNTDRPTLQRLFGGHINNIQEPADHLVKAGMVSPCGKNIVEFIDGIYEDSVLRAKSVPLPHGGNNSDHRSVIKRQFQSRFQDLETDGVYIERPFDELQAGTLTILQGDDPQWGNRRRGVLPTGDSRDATFSRLGVHTCWIRLGEPTTEAIRQALLADEARITYATPVAPLQRILSVSIGSTMTGANFAITFNEGANAFIGGRGSGKTSVLEYLRFALGRSSLDLAMPDKEAGTREREMLKTTLKGGGVRATLLRDGIEETWERRFDSMSTITVSSTAAPSNVQTINVEQAQTRFFARAFSQKQLSSLISDPKDADEQITGVAAAEVRVERQASLNEIERRRQEVRLAFEGVVLHWQHTQAFEEARGRSTDVERRSAAMAAELEKAGLSEAARNAIAADAQYRAANRTLSTVRGSVDLLSAKATELKKGNGPTYAGNAKLSRGASVTSDAKNTGRWDSGATCTNRSLDRVYSSRSNHPANLVRFQTRRPRQGTFGRSPATEVIGRTTESTGRADEREGDSWHRNRSTPVRGRITSNSTRSAQREDYRTACRSGEPPLHSRPCRCES